MKNFVVWAILLFTTIFGACDMPQNLLVHFFVDDSLSGEQYDAVQEAVQEWNNKAGTLLDPPQDVLFLDGFYSSDQDPETDGAHVVYYPKNTPAKIAGYEKNTNQDFWGVYWNTPTSFFSPESRDIYIFQDKIETFWEENDLKNKEGYVKERWLSFTFQVLLLHEFGHSLGLKHIKEDVVAVMQEHISNMPNHLTKEDLNQFCKIYACK